MKYKVTVKENQLWAFEYQVEAKSSEEASCIAESLHFEGVQSYDSWIEESAINKVFVKDTIDA